MTTSCGCAIFLFSNDKILIQKRTMTKKRYPGYWEIPGGAIEDHEMPEDCIQREIGEELGVEVSNLERLYTDVVYRDEKRDIVFIFKGQCPYDLIVPDPTEVEEYCLIGSDDVDNYDFYPAVREQIKRYFGIEK